MLRLGVSGPGRRRADPTAADTVTTRYGVAGMTRGHCVGAVTAELGAVESVQSVAVDLVAGGTSVVTSLTA